MNEPSTKKRPSVLVIAAVLALPTFGGGLFVGKASVKAAPEQAPLVVDDGAEPAVDDAAAMELAACQRKLARRSKESGTGTAWVEVERQQHQEPTPEQQRQIEWLEDEISERKRSAMLHSAFVCKTVRRHVDLMMALPDDGKGCLHKRVAVDLIKMNFEKCGQFQSLSTSLDDNDLTDEERSSVLNAESVAKSITKEELSQLDSINAACMKTKRSLARPPETQK